jgi:hypothetical protein
MTKICQENARHFLILMLGAYNEKSLVLTGGNKRFRGKQVKCLWQVGILNYSE